MPVPSEGSPSTLESTIFEFFKSCILAIVQSVLSCNMCWHQRNSSFSTNRFLIFSKPKISAKQQDCSRCHWKLSTLQFIFRGCVDESLLYKIRCLQTYLDVSGPRYHLFTASSSPITRWLIACSSWNCRLRLILVGLRLTRKWNEEWSNYRTSFFNFRFWAEMGFFNALLSCSFRHPVVFFKISQLRNENWKNLYGNRFILQFFFERDEFDQNHTKLRKYSHFWWYLLFFWKF